MQSRWSDADATAAVERLAPQWGEDMALRVYTSRLIGSDPELVLHGGGNTSLKGTATTIVGDEVEVLFVKGSGWDLDALEPAGLPAVRLDPLRRLRGLEALSDEEMVNQLRINLLDASAPNPSVETLLHAFLPHRFIDHTHADIALAVTNQPDGDGEELAREAFGPRWALVPYVMPGFDLARRAAEVFDADPTVEGLVLRNHGLFSFADDARTAYERMIEAVDRAEQFVQQHRGHSRVGQAPPIRPTPAAADLRRALGPSLRGALTAPTGDPDRPWAPVVLDHRTDDELLALLEHPDAARLAAANPLTPDHVIRTKGPALLVDIADFADIADVTTSAEDLRAGLDGAVAGFRDTYTAYVAANRHRARSDLVPLDPSPRVVLVPGVGLYGVGRTAGDARIAADIAEHTVRTKALADSLGRYTGLDDGDLFDMEYWSLEQAKLGKAAPASLTGQVALVTGATGAIGFAVCAELIATGANVVVTDLDADRVAAAVDELDPRGRGVAAGAALDVTDEGSVAAGVDAAVAAYGGIDLLVLNAGVAHVSAIEHTEPSDFRRVVDVNLVGGFLVLRAVASVMRAQGTGGNVVVNSSKNVFGPGADFGAYDASKAGAHQLAKVAALELAASGIRVNMINADAVFGDDARPSGLWQEVGPARARSRGLDPAELQEYYRGRNLLKARITPEHVGRAVVFFATNQTPTTGATLPVDGGVADAFPR